MPGAPPPAGSVTCPSCGWANVAGAARCDFCKRPLGAPAPASPLPAPRPPRPAEEVREAAESLRETLLTPRKLIVGAIVGVGFLGFWLQLRLQDASTTADHLRQVRQALRIYGGENGGYPATLEPLERRGLPPIYLKDAWGRPLRYVPSEPRGTNEAGEALFLRCELRSAGRNGRFDDGDDVMWKGDPP